MLPLLPILGGLAMLVGLLGKRLEQSAPVVHNHFYEGERPADEHLSAEPAAPRLTAAERAARKERAAARRAAARAAMVVADEQIEIDENPYEGETP